MVRKLFNASCFFMSLSSDARAIGCQRNKAKEYQGREDGGSSHSRALFLVQKSNLPTLTHRYRWNETRLTFDPITVALNVLENKWTF